MPIYVWEKYNATPVYRELYVTDEKPNVQNDTVYLGTSYSFDKGTGIYTLNNPKQMTTSTNTTADYPCAMINATSGGSMYKAPIGSSSLYWEWHSYQLTCGSRSPKRYESTSSLTGKGSYIGDVYSAEAEAYPQDGAQDGYYYVFKETIP